MPGITGPLIDEAYDLDGQYNADYVLGLGYTTDFDLAIAPPVIVILFMPLIIFEADTRAMAGEATVDLLAWSAEEAHMAGMSEERTFLYASDERAMAGAATVDLLIFEADEQHMAGVTAERGVE